MKILAVCGAGMGTSLIMKMKLSQFAQDEGLDVMVESCGLDEAKGTLRDYQIVICAVHLAEELGPIPATTELVTVENLMNIASYADKVKALVTGNAN